MHQLYFTALMHIKKGWCNAVLLMKMLIICSLLLMTYMSLIHSTSFGRELIC